MQLGREADLDVAHPLGLVVLGQLVGHPLQGRPGLQDGRGVGESLEVVGQAGVLALEDQAAQSGLVCRPAAGRRCSRASSIRVGRRSEPSRCR